MIYSTIHVSVRCASQTDFLLYYPHQNLLYFAIKNYEAVVIVEDRVSDEAVVIYVPLATTDSGLDPGQGGGFWEAVEAVTTSRWEKVYALRVLYAFF